MGALLLPLLNALLGGLITPFVTAWVNYKTNTATIKEQGFAAGAAADATVMQAALANDVQLAALKVQVYGQPINRLIMLIAGVPPALHFGLIFIDTIVASKAFLGAPFFGVAKLPAPYDTFEWAIVSSFFLVHAVTLGTSNVSSWLGKAK
ncbi:conserved membrane hypothetical protein [Methylocella tundrae]|uniref:Uncharacterized protein n=1 Tax=Methylocella tundrae TaxID=227605 RepID=A0A8B6MD72_METTU|nr:hypothetical protein [Methylocella tundrae]VTZ24344.1 conserved membrane hypothetical protein [Methylocella tundrae]VTZ52458.1 conserved membrane hypothetical protein [Methylocella tundrae]